MKHPDLLEPIAVPAPTARDWSIGIVVDNFAGGGGASTGIEEATGRPVDVAVNHDPEAIAMHIANHPGTRHHCQSIWSIDPIEAVTIDGTPQPVWLIWFSPDCTHHSNARGGKPRQKNIRDLAWVVIHWIERLGPALKPAIICLENVEEFLSWGPLDGGGRRIMERAGEEFQAFVAAFRRNGYKVEWRVVRACDHGAPTIRKRLVLKARCDGQPIEWAEPSHGPGRARPYRTAAECIDWSLPCPSIFLTKEEGAAIGVKRPLAEATMRRIARGVMRYVVEAAEPFIVSVAHGDSGGRREYGIGEPLGTATGRGIQHAVVVPTLINTRNGEREGQAPRVHDIRSPYPTITAAGSQGAVVAAHLMTMRNAQKPFNGADEPTHTITAGGARLHLVSAFLAQYNNDRGVIPNAGHDVRDPLSTVATKGPHQGLVAAHLLSLKGSDRRDQRIDGPAPAITAGGFHVAEVRAFLLKYYGTDQDPRLEEPLHSITTKDRFGLVIVVIGGVEYAIVDIGMRMLTPPELAAAQGFPPGYILNPIFNGKPLSKTAQVRMIGNSVSPPMARAEVEAVIGRAEAEAA